MNVKHLLSVFVLLMVSLTVTSQDLQAVSGCRRGTPRKAVPHAPSMQRRTVEKADLYKGNRRQLVVLAAFGDRSFTGEETETIEIWEKIFNTEHFGEQPFYGSVHDYFYCQSYEQFDLAFDLQYVALSKPHATYGSTQWDDENSQYLVDDVVDELQTRDIDWSPYDWDGDGIVEQLLIVYAGKGSSYGGFGGGKDAIWPHQWWLSEHLDLKTEAPYDHREARTVTSGDREYTVDCYCAVQELASNGSYGSFGTICHEYSHCFGFPDFYTSDGSVVGDWDVMDRGNYNGSGFRPCGYSAYERMFMGWLQPVELTEPVTVTGMPALDGEPQAYIIRNDGYTNEYYLLENRRMKGWDAMLPGTGILIFHVDYDPDIWTSKTEPVNTSYKQRYRIIPANNMAIPSFSMRWPYPYNGNNQLTNTSTPAAVLNNSNVNGTFLMSKPLTNMAVTEGLASFDFCAGPPSAVVNVTGSGRSQLLYQIGPVSIVRDASGKVRKLVRQRSSGN